jgi:hypothetical protein
MKVLLHLVLAVALTLGTTSAFGACGTGCPFDHCAWGCAEFVRTICYPEQYCYPTPELVEELWYCNFNFH